MSTRSRRATFPALAALALTAFLAGMSTSAYADDTVPPDVQDAYSQQAIDYLRTSSEGTVDVGNIGDSEVPDFSSAARFGTPHEIYSWSSGMIAGDTKVDPVAASGEWLAPILTETGDVLGTYRVWRPSEGAKAEMAGYNNDVDLGRQLGTLSATARLVNDAPSAEWLSLDRGTVSALNQTATVEVPYPVPVAELTPIVAKRYAQAIEDAKGRDDAVGGGGPRDDQRPWYYGMNLWVLTGGVIALAAGIAGVTIVLVRRQRGAGQKPA